MKKHLIYTTIILYLILFCISLNTELFNIINEKIEIPDKLELPKTIEPKHIFITVVILAIVSVLGYSYFCHYIDIPIIDSSGSITHDLLHIKANLDSNFSKNNELIKHLDD